MTFEDVRKLYEEDMKSPYEIAKQFGTYPNKVRSLLKRYGVQLRDKSEAQKNFLNQGGEHPTKGKPRTKDEKERIGKSVHNKWNRLSKEEKDRRIELNKKAWDELSDADKKDMQKKAHEAIRKTAREGSRLEKGIYTLLLKDGFDTTFHFDGIAYGEQLELDIFLHGDKIVIEIDGISHYEPIWGEDALKKQQDSDNKKNGILISKGVYVIRLINYAKSLSETKIKNAYNLIKDAITEIKNETVTNARVIHIPFCKED